MSNSHISNVYPHLEKFWIILDTQTTLGGVDWVTHESGNKSVKIPFNGYGRTPYAYTDEKIKFEVKMIRYVIDSLIPNFLNYKNIYELEIILIKDPSAIEYPEKYAIYLPTTNSLITQLPIDDVIWQVSNSAMIIKLDQSWEAVSQTEQ